MQTLLRQENTCLLWCPDTTCQLLGSCLSPSPSDSMLLWFTCNSVRYPCVLMSSLPPPPSRLLPIRHIPFTSGLFISDFYTNEEACSTVFSSFLLKMRISFGLSSTVCGLNSRSISWSWKTVRMWQQGELASKLPSLWLLPSIEPGVQEKVPQ